jgi:hypothetical protein
MFRSKGRYITRCKARVIDNRDPLKKGRILVRHPLLKDGGAWIPYLQGPNQFDSPSVGDIVYVEAECGDFDYLVASGKYIKGKDENPDIPEEFKREVPTNRGFYTPGGHLIEFDDGEAEPTANPAENDVSETKRGVRVTTSGGNKVHISDEDGTITLTNTNGKIFKLDDKQILGSGAEPIVLGDTQKTILTAFLSAIEAGVNPGTPAQNALSLLAIKAAAIALKAVLPTMLSRNSSTD